MTAPQTDCRHFQGDRPCAPHKAEGVACERSCPHYDPAATRLLIVKLAAMGDVLRTTSLLPAIHQRWPGAHLTWVTAPGSVPLLERNPLIDRVVSFDGSGLPLALNTERYDAVLCPDADPVVTALGQAAHTGQRVGFGFDGRGASLPLTPGAKRWYAMGLDDALKKANTRTYQSLMCDVLEIEDLRDPPAFELDDATLATSAALRARHLPPSGAIVGLNTGAGGRWRFKRWTEEGYLGLIQRLTAAGQVVFLLGGPEERERNARLAAASPGVVDTGCDNNLMEFAGIVQACDTVVTGDTLAMHIAIARRVPVVVLFGPTSLHEIDVFDRGERLAPELSCLVCYLMDCDKQPNCMEALGLDRVHEAVLRQLGVPRMADC